jgi:thymidylate synthase (FAD)
MRAQWEIRELAETIYKEVKKVAPTLFSIAGPACVTDGVCPEGKMTCGHILDVREKYRAL